MKRFYNFFFTLLFIAAAPAVIAQHKLFFHAISETVIPQDTLQKRLIIPSRYQVMQADTLQLAHFLEAVSNQDIADRNNMLVIAVPLPDGRVESFHIWETPIMEKPLAEKYPSIRTYTGQGIEDRTATIKIDWTPVGFHAMVLSPSTGSFFIDPYRSGDLLHYIVYFGADLENTHAFTEPAVNPAGSTLNLLNRPAFTDGFEPSMGCIGEELRTYRIAVACTGEYALAATGLPNPTVAQTLSAIVLVLNRVNGIYESELDIHFNLVANDDTVVFNDPATDPFIMPVTNPSYADYMLSSSQSLLDDYIGNANYDLGQLFNTGGGGLTSYNAGGVPGIVCVAGYKGSCETGISNPVGDIYSVDYVSHEIGHQFGAYHSYNSVLNYCGAAGQFSPVSNSEPGSGSTIMCYAEGAVANSSALCGTDNLQPHSDPYFNALGFDEIVQYAVQDNGNNCAVVTATGNHAPVASAGNDYTIPMATPFVLTGSATDPDNDALTYCWEQVNIGGPGGTWDHPHGDAPIFRSFSPTESPVRSFPQLSDVIHNTTTIGELLPSYARTLDFRLTVRDNRAGGGGVCNDQNKITVIDSAGPFTVTYPDSTDVIWHADDPVTITWNPAHTQSAPINCSQVMILLSVDGGYTYPDTLLASTPNSGSAQVVVPNVVTSSARIKVMAVGNIFYDISNQDFPILSSTTEESWIVYPNPTAQGSIQLLSNKNNTLVQLNLFDDLGRSVSRLAFSNTLLGQPVTIPLTNIAAGIYLLRIRTDHGISMHKIVVVK